MAKRYALATAVALTCGGFVVPHAHAAPAEQACTVELDPESFAQATDTAHRYLERDTRQSRDRYASFRAAFPELATVEADVQRRIRDEELGVYLAEEHFADPSTIEYRYAVERFAEEDLPESVAAWYLSRHALTRIQVTPPMDDIEKYHAFVATEGHIPVGPDDPEWFVHTGIATDPEGIAAALQARFEQLSTPMAQRWAEKLATTRSYETARAVDAYADRFESARRDCEAQRLQGQGMAGAATQAPAPQTRPAAVIAGVVMLLGLLGYGAFAYVTYYA